MHKFLLATAAAASLGVLGLVPGQAKASWLSEALHRRFDPGYYAYPYYGPAYGYYGPAPAYNWSAPSYSDYYAPGYSYSPGYSTYYGWYGAPGGSYWGGPRYYGNFDRHDWHARNEHHEREWHGGHEHHH